jgi:hypothetical protein
VKRRSAAPFLQLSAAVQAGPWMGDLDDRCPEPLGMMLADWEYGARLHLSRTLTIDGDLARRELDFGAPAALELMVEVGSGPGNLPRSIVQRHRVPLSVAGGSVRVDFAVPSGQLSSQLILRTAILLSAGSREAGRLSPLLAGSRLWSDVETVMLEGDDPRFPMEVTSFSRMFSNPLQAEASWYLRWNPAQLGRDFRGGVRLYLNGDDPDFIRRVQEQDVLTLQAMMGDVVSQICESGLHDPEFADLIEDADEGTMAAQVDYWLCRAFGSVAEARSAMEQRPGDFRAAILGSMRL